MSADNFFYQFHDESSKNESDISKNMFGQGLCNFTILRCFKNPFGEALSVNLKSYTILQTVLKNMPFEFHVERSESTTYVCSET